MASIIYVMNVIMNWTPLRSCSVSTACRYYTNLSNEDVMSHIQKYGTFPHNKIKLNFKCLSEYLLFIFIEYSLPIDV